MKFLSNPYNFSIPAETNKTFFNHTYEIRNFLRTVIAQDQSVQLVGQYRIGKSSILKYLEKNGASLAEEENLIPIYFDLSRHPMVQNAEDFFSRLWRKAAQALVERGEKGAALEQQTDFSDVEEFENYIVCWRKKAGYHFVFLLDEFGVIAADEKYAEDFFANIRSTITWLTYAFATPLPLSQYAHQGVKTSPLFNLLSMIQLHLFDNETVARKLICQPAEDCGRPWQPTDVEWIYERGGQHPCFLQMAAGILFDNWLEGETRPDLTHAEPSFRINADEHFKFLWNRALGGRDDQDQIRALQTTLLDLVQGHGLDNEMAEKLHARGFVWKNPETNDWEPLSVWFADWLRRFTTKRRVEAGQAIKKEYARQPAQEPVVGQEIQGKYIILDIISHTNNNVLVRAWDKDTRRAVALKFIRFDAHTNPEVRLEFQGRLKREAAILGPLDHPNVGRVLDVLKDPVAIVMAWVEGVSLKDILDAGSKLTTEQVVTIGIQMADVLQYIHRCGVYHRDIKPGNIILSIDRKSILKAVLVDFDIARANNRDSISIDSTGVHHYVGTREYSAPEQFLHPDGVGGSTDVFSLGMVLYQMLNRALPFQLGPVPALYKEGKLPVLQQLDMDDELYTILLGMMKENHWERPEAEQVKTALEAYERKMQHNL